MIFNGNKRFIVSTLSEVTICMGDKLKIQNEFVFEDLEKSIDLLIKSTNIEFTLDSQL